MDESPAPVEEGAPGSEPAVQAEELPAPVGWDAGRHAPEPFVFRSGGIFGSGKKVHSIQEAATHIDHHPADGIYHLQNGTLAQWLEAQKAHDLAYLAHQVATAGYTDPRVMLETFLLGTGLVSRPSLVLQPKEIRMGYILAGQSCSQDLQIRKGRGRGHLFGRVHRTDPWLSLDPTVFSGRSTKINISVDTHTLPISPNPQVVEITVESSGSEQPVAVPVSFRVMGMPSRLNRFLIRPLASLLVGGALGAGLGWLLAQSGVGLPGWLQLAPTPLMWAALVGAPWAVLAGIRGYMEPLAWPLLYTMGRWLLRTLIWAVTIAASAAAVLGLWRQLHLQLGLAAPLAWTSTLIGALALAVLPGILGELWNTRGTRGASPVSRRMPVLRPGLMIASAAVICALALAGVRFAAPTLQQVDAASVLDSTEGWVQQQLGRLDSTLNHWIDQLYLRMYDRRAPAQPTPTAPSQPRPTPSPEPKPTGTRQQP